jgi:uncharacterized protein
MRIMRLPARGLVGLLRAYHRYYSPLRPPACRFTPSCSVYASTAIERFGVVRGGWLALRRLAKCHPYHRGGHDPVPPRVDRNGAAPAASVEPISSRAGAAYRAEPAERSQKGLRCHTF